MRSDNTKWELKPHTGAKHAILRRYLGAWFPIMSRHNRRVVFLDGFAGPGVYSGGEPGSPQIALDALLEHKYAGGMSHCEFVFWFIEAHPGRFASLATVVEAMQRSKTFPKNVKVVLEQGEFMASAEAALASIETRGASLAPTFAFVDPFGYAGIPMATLQRLLSFEKCELFLYLDINSLIRFGTAGNVDAQFTSLMGTEEYKNAPATGVARRDFLRELYERQLMEKCGFTYAHSFLMRGENNRPICYLVYATRSVTGLSAMKEAMWKVAPTGDYSFSDGDSDQGVLFSEEPDTTLLARRLVDRFAGHPVSIEAVEEFTVTETPFLKTHIKSRTLKPMEKSGRLAATGPVGKQHKRGTYPPGTMLTFSG